MIKEAVVKEQKPLLARGQEPGRDKDEKEEDNDEDEDYQEKDAEEDEASKRRLPLAGSDSRAMVALLFHCLFSMCQASAGFAGIRACLTAYG